MGEVFDITSSRKPTAFSETLEAAEYGDKIIYCRGEYATGAYKREALDALTSGRVSLVQKRLGAHQFEYIAQVIRGRTR